MIFRKNRAEAIEVSIFEYDEEKELELFRAAEREEGLQEGLDYGLRALVSALKKVMTNADEIYAEAVRHSKYADLSKEEFEKIYHEL